MSGSSLSRTNAGGQTQGLKEAIMQQIYTPAQPQRVELTSYYWSARIDAQMFVFPGWWFTYVNSLGLLWRSGGRAHFGWVLSGVLPAGAALGD